MPSARAARRARGRYARRDLGGPAAPGRVLGACVIAEPVVEQLSSRVFECGVQPPIDRPITSVDVDPDESSARGGHTRIPEHICGQFIPLEGGVEVAPASRYLREPDRPDPRARGARSGLHPDATKRRRRVSVRRPASRRSASGAGRTTAVACLDGTGGPSCTLRTGRRGTTTAHGFIGCRSTTRESRARVVRDRLLDVQPGWVRTIVVAHPALHVS